MLRTSNVLLTGVFPGGIDGGARKSLSKGGQQADQFEFIVTGLPFRTAEAFRRTGLFPGRIT